MPGKDRDGIGDDERLEDYVAFGADEIGGGSLIAPRPVGVPALDIDESSLPINVAEGEIFESETNAEAMLYSSVVARKLARQFLAEGLFEAMDSPMDRSAVIAATSGAPESDFLDEESGFASLSLQAVGHSSKRSEDGHFAPVVKLYVTKGSRAFLNRLPSSIDGVNVEVTNVGKVQVRPEAASSANRYGKIFTRKGRIACGSSCAPAGESYAGTFGAILENEDGYFALSNNHVFAACNHTPIAQPILAPSPLDARPGEPAPREICQHFDIIELRSGTPALVPLSTADAAVARISDIKKVSSWQGDTGTGYKTPVNTLSPEPEMSVKKVGRTTGLTTGKIDAFIADPWALPYKCKDFVATVWFADVWTVRSDTEHFALPGDSGSLVVTEDGNHAIGLLFACTRKGDYGFILPINHVLDHFDASLWSGH